MIQNRSISPCFTSSVSNSVSADATSTGSWSTGTSSPADRRCGSLLSLPPAYCTEPSACRTRWYRSPSRLRRRRVHRIPQKTNQDPWQYRTRYTPKTTHENSVLNSVNLYNEYVKHRPVEFCTTESSFYLQPLLPRDINATAPCSFIRSYSSDLIGLEGWIITFVE